MLESIELENDEESYEEGHLTRQYCTYSEDAIILQSILEYCEHNVEFTIDHLIENHLLKNCQFFIELYDGSYKNKTPQWAKVAKNRKKVIELVEKLSFLGLVECDICNQDDKSPDKFRYSLIGRMIGFLLLYNKGRLRDKKGMATMYGHIYNYFYSLNHSHAKLCLLFFEACYSGNRFVEVIYSILGLLYAASDEKDDFLSKLRFFNIFYIDIQLWNFYLDSLERLEHNDKVAYEKVLMNLKLTIEDLQELKCRFCRELETSRFSLWQHIDRVSLHGQCSKCKKFVIADSNVIDYLDRYIEIHTKGQQPPEMRCPSCKAAYIDYEIIV